MACLVLKSSNKSVDLWSLDSLLLGFSATVVGWTFAVVGFLDFMSWLGHDVPDRFLMGC